MTNPESIKPLSLTERIAKRQQTFEAFKVKSSKSGGRIIGPINGIHYKICWIHLLPELMPKGQAYLLYNKKKNQVDGFDRFCKCSCRPWTKGKNDRNQFALPAAESEKETAHIHREWNVYVTLIGTDTKPVSLCADTEEEAIESLKSGKLKGIELSSISYTYEQVEAFIDAQRAMIPSFINFYRSRN